MLVCQIKGLSFGLKNEQSYIMINEKKFITRVNDYLAREVFPGCEFTLIDRDETQHYYLLGNEEILPEKKRLKAGKRWDLASVSKVVGTGSLVIDEVLAGRIDLDHSLKSYLPNWHEKSITVRQLLTHTTGINPYIENRNELGFSELKKVILGLELKTDQSFYYTDVNFILLGFMLEEIFEKDLDQLLAEKVFIPRKMFETTYSPVENAVVTDYKLPAGIVHDPKAQVLGGHCGSAGLFSSMKDLQYFINSYLYDKKYLKLYENYSPDPHRVRSMGWGFQTEEWLIHTGYTGTFLMMNLKQKQAVIFLSNRVHLKDERDEWIKQRDALIQDFIDCFE